MVRTLLLAGAALALAAAPLAPRAAAQAEVHVQFNDTLPRAWMGVSLDREADAPDRAVIRSVFPGSAAARAGLRPGDVVLSVDGQPATDQAVDALGRDRKPGDTVRVRLLRDGRESEVAVVLGARPGVRVLARSLYGPGADSARAFLFETDSAGALRMGRMSVHADSGIIEFHRESGRVTVIRTDSLLLRADSLAMRMDSLREMIVLSPGAREHVMVRGDSSGRIEIRGGTALEDALRIGEEMRLPEGVVLPARADGQAAPFFWEVGRRALAGAELAEMNEGLGRYFPVAEGLLVLKVSPGTPAARAGLEAGDVVVKAAGGDVRSVRDLRRVIGEDEDGRAELEVVRQGRRRTLELQWDREPVRVFSRSVVRARGGAEPEGTR